MLANMVRRGREDSASGQVQRRHCDLAQDRHRGDIDYGLGKQATQQRHP